MPIEAPNEFRQVDRGGAQQRSQRNTRLPRPEEFRPQARTVDLGNPQADTSKLEMLQNFKQLVGAVAGAAGNVGGMLEEGADKAKKIGASIVGEHATNMEEMLAGKSPEEQDRIRGQSYWVRRGYKEQFARNKAMRAGSGFDTALGIENDRRQKAGEPLLLDSADVMEFANEFFDSENISGDDDDANSVYQDEVGKLKDSIFQDNEEREARRSVAESNLSSAQLSRDATSAVVGDDAGKLPEDFLFQELKADAESRAFLEARDPDKLKGEAIDSTFLYLDSMVENGNFADLDADSLARIEENLSSLAGGNVQNGTKLRAGMDNLQSRLDGAQKAYAEAREEASDGNVLDIQSGVTQALISGNESEARKLALGLVEEGWSFKDIGDYINDEIQGLGDLTGFGATQDAIDEMYAYLDTGPTQAQVNSKIRSMKQQGVIFDRGTLDKFRTQQNQNERNRHALKNSPNYQARRKAIQDLTKAAGRLEGSDEGYEDGKIDPGEDARNRTLVGITKRFERRINTWARANPELALQDGVELEQVVEDAYSEAQQAIREIGAINLIGGEDALPELQNRAAKIEMGNAIEIEAEASGRTVQEVNARLRERAEANRIASMTPDQLREERIQAAKEAKAAEKARAEAELLSFMQRAFPEGPETARGVPLLSPDTAVQLSTGDPSTVSLRESLARSVGQSAE